MEQKQEKHVGLVTVHFAQGMLRATVVRGALESAGIPVLLSYEAAGPTLGINVDGIGRVAVMVPKEWEKQALEYLNTQPKSGEVFSVPKEILENE